MSGWTQHDGLAVALPLDNVDTDQILPARFMSQPRRDGYGGFLFHDLARDAGGARDPEFPLTRVPDATVLVTGRNFGTGSSREAAVYALLDAGIRAVLAPSFGDIFAANAVNNGLLPARVAPADAAEALRALDTATAPARIDLASGTARIGAVTLTFDLAPGWREKLINGWDDIDLPRAHTDAIRAFRNARADRNPWAIGPKDTTPTQQGGTP